MIAMETKIIAMLRIAKKEYQEKIYKTGQFYMNTSEYFREMAQKDNSGLIGDIHETSFPRNYRIVASGLEMRAFDESDDECQAMTLGINTCIFCFYAISREMCKDIDGTLYYTIPRSTIEGIIGSDDPNRYEIVLFMQPELLVQKINKKIDSLGLNHSDGMVVYDDHCFNISPELMLKDLNDFGMQLCFHKCRKFSNQNEYRIVIVNDSGRARDDIIIGTLDASEYKTFIVPSIDKNVIIKIS